MKVLITTLRPADPTEVCNELSDAGVHDATVTVASNDRLEVACRDDEFDQVVAAMAHDGRVKTAVICADRISGTLKNLTRRACR